MSSSSFLRSILLIATLTAVNACIFCPFLPSGLIPSQCYPQLQSAGECFVQRSCQRCLGGGGASLNSAARVGKALDFFYMPIDADTCEEMEQPICPLTETCCRSCRGPINALYRCMIRNSNGMGARANELQRTCRLDCQGSSTMGSGGQEIVEVTTPEPVDTNTTDANVTKPVYIAEEDNSLNSTDTNTTEIDVEEGANATDTSNVTTPTTEEDGSAAAAVARTSDFGY